MPLEVTVDNVRVIRLVSIIQQTIRDITNDPNDEPWFYMAIFFKDSFTKDRYHIITKDGISYRYVGLGYPNNDIKYFGPKDQLIVQEAIENYVNEL